MAWTRQDVHKSTHPSLVEEWVSIMARRKVIKPQCKKTGSQILQSIRNLIHFEDDLGNRVTVSFLDKPGNKSRLEGFATPAGQNDNGKILEGLAAAVQSELAAGKSAVYWYDDTPGETTLDTTIFPALASALFASSSTDGSFTVYEVTA